MCPTSTASSSCNCQTLCCTSNFLKSRNKEEFWVSIIGVVSGAWSPVWPNYTKQHLHKHIFVYICMQVDVSVFLYYLANVREKRKKTEDACIRNGSVACTVSLLEQERQLSIFFTWSKKYIYYIQITSKTQETTKKNPRDNQKNWFL